MDNLDNLGQICLKQAPLDFHTYQAVVPCDYICWHARCVWPR